MTEWRVDYRPFYCRWVTVGWWNTRKAARKFIRDQASACPTRVVRD